MLRPNQSEAEVYDRAHYVKLTFNLDTKRVRMPHKAYTSLIDKFKEKFPPLQILLEHRARPQVLKIVTQDGTHIRG